MRATNPAMNRPTSTVTGDRGIEEGLLTSTGERVTCDPSCTLARREYGWYPEDFISIKWLPQLRFPRLTGVFPINTKSRYTEAPGGVDVMEIEPLPDETTGGLGVVTTGTVILTGVDELEISEVTGTVMFVSSGVREEATVSMILRGDFIVGLLTVRKYCPGCISTWKP